MPNGQFGGAGCRGTEPETMCRPLRPANEAILSGFLLWRIVLVSALMAVGVFGIFGWASTHASSLEEARTYAVITLVAGSILPFQRALFARSVWNKCSTRAPP